MRRLDLEPRQSGGDDPTPQGSEPLVEQLVESRRKLRFGHDRKNAHVQEPVVEEGLGAELAASAGLAAVADGEDEKLSLPLEAATLEASLLRANRREVRQTREEIRGAAEELLQLRGRGD